MPKIIYRLPSKAIQYGYAELEMEISEEEAADPQRVGAAYATYVGAFLEGEQGGLDLFLRGRSESPSEGHTEPSVGSPEAAAERLKNEQKPRTVDEANEMATQLIQQELGATVIESEENVPPWKKKAEPQAKPWQKTEEKAASKAAAVADIDW